MANTETSKSEAPWFAKYPELPTESLESITPIELLNLIKDGKESTYILVDVRRADHEGGTIRGSINLPAHSLYPSIPTLYPIFKASGRPLIIWYCNSCRGRGLRATAWFRQFIEKEGDNTMKSVFLVGGIKGWVASGPEFTSEMVEYDEAYWKT